MFGIGSGELLLIAVFAIIIFGPDKLPEMARSIGKIMREFNRAKDTMESQIRAEMFTADKAEIEKAGADVAVPESLPTVPHTYDDDMDEELEEEEEA